MLLLASLLEMIEESIDRGEPPPMAPNKDLVFVLPCGHLYGENSLQMLAGIVFLRHRPPAVRAFSSIARRARQSLSLANGEVEVYVCKQKTVL